jgi:hypothetical protein
MSTELGAPGPSARTHSSITPCRKYSKGFPYGWHGTVFGDASIAETVLRTSSTSSASEAFCTFGRSAIDLTPRSLEFVDEGPSRQTDIGKEFRGAWCA